MRYSLKDVSGDMFMGKILRKTLLPLYLLLNLIKKVIVTSVIIFAAIHSLNAEYRSNLYLFEQTYYTPPEQFDFSEITDSTLHHYDSNVVSADVFISHGEKDTIFSPYGVYCYGDINFYHINGWWFNTDSIEIYKNKGDSIIWEASIIAPQDGYTDTIIKPSYNTLLFIVKTSENQHALFILVANYVGGLNREQYYWALQTDGSGIFQKETSLKHNKSSAHNKNVYITQTKNSIIVNSLTKPSVISNVKLFDMKGRVVYTCGRSTSNQLCISKSGLSGGCYFIKLYTDKKVVIHRVLIGFLKS